MIKWQFLRCLFLVVFVVSLLFLVVFVVSLLFLVVFVGSLLFLVVFVVSLQFLVVLWSFLGHSTHEKLPNLSCASFN